MRFIAKSEGGIKNRVKLKSGESIRGVFRGDPIDFKQHWVNDRGITCSGTNECGPCEEGKKPSFRFRINFVTSENGVYSAKVFEQGWNAYVAMRSLHEDYNLEKYVVKITRTGSDKQTTKYSIVPMPNGEVTPDLEKKIAEIELNDLSGSQKNPETPDSVEEVDEDIGF